LRLDDELSRPVDEAVFVADAHIGEPAVERERAVELRLDHDSALCVDIAILAGDVVSDAHRRQAFGERARRRELQRDHDRAPFVDIAEPARVRDKRESVAERPRRIKLRRNDQCSLLVYIAPFAFDEFADPHRREAFGEREQIDDVELRLDDELTAFVDVPDPVAGAGRGQPFGERIGEIELRRDHCLAFGVDIAIAPADAHRRQTFRELPRLIELRIDDEPRRQRLALRRCRRRIRGCLRLLAASGEHQHGEHKTRVAHGRTPDDKRAGPEGPPAAT
jgi:hypothetical protein